MGAEIGKLPAESELKAFFEAVFHFLLGEDYDLRRDALIALSKLRGQVASEIIFERYRSDNLDEYLSLAMKEMDPEAAAKAFVQALGDVHLEVRVRAAEGLAQKPTDGSIHVLTLAVEEYLQSLAGSSTKGILNAESMHGAIRALGTIGTPICLSLLQKLVLHEPGEKTRATAVASLGEHMNESLLSMFQGLLKDSDPRVRANAIEGMQNLDNASVIAILQPYLYDSHQRVRANAAKAIWKYGDYDVSITLKEMLVDADKKHRVSALYAIGEICLETMRKAVLEGLKDPDPDVRRNAVVAMRKMGKETRSLDLLPMLHDSVPAVRVQAVLAVGGIFKQNGTKALLARLLKEEEVSVKVTILEVLGTIGDESALGAIAECLDADDDRLVHAALDSVFRIKPTEPSPGMLLSLKKFLNREQPDIKAHAIRILWNWGQIEVLSQVLALLKGSDLERQRMGLMCGGDLLASISKGDLAARSFFERILKAVASSFRQVVEKDMAGQVVQKMNDLFQQAQEELQHGMLDQSRQSFDQVLAIRPDYLPARMGLAEIAMRAGEDFDAEQLLTNIIQDEPNLAKGHYLLGQIFHKRQDWSQAVVALQKTIKLQPKLVQAYVMLSEALERLRMYDGAGVVLERLQKLVPKNPQILQRQARVFFLQGKAPQAIEMARMAADEGKVGLGTILILAVGDFFQGNPNAGGGKLIKCLSALSSLQNGAKQEFMELLPRARSLLEAMTTLANKTPEN